MERGGGSAHARSAQTVNASVLIFLLLLLLLMLNLQFNSSFWVFVNYVLKLNIVI